MPSEMSVRRTFLRLLGSLRNLAKVPYENNRPKHEPTDSYFYIARQLAKCMMRYDTLNWHGYGGHTKMTDPSSNDNSTDKDESKRIIVHETLLQNCSANKDKSKKLSSTTLYRRTIPRIWTNYVQQR